MGATSRGRGATLTRRIVFLLVALVTLYVLWPSLIAVFSTSPELLTLNPGWIVVMLALEAGSFSSAWALQRVALRTHQWFGVATSQLAGNAVSRIVPGGAAAGGAVQYHMLVAAGVETTAVGTGLAAASIISTATLFALPLLAVPPIIAGRPVPDGLAQAAWLGAGAFMLAFAAGWVLLTRDSAVDRVGRAIEWIINRFRRGRPSQGLPDRLRVARDAIRRDLGRKWWQALFASLGNWLFDYLALLAALTAVGSRPRPSLVLLAYGASMLLGMIPLTPGGLGFVEAGLTTLLVLAGVSARDAALATLAYRLVSYWLPLPAGGIAAALHRRRYGRRSVPTLRSAVDPEAGSDQGSNA